MDVSDGWFVDRSPGRGRYIFTENTDTGGGAGGGDDDKHETDGTRTYINGLIGIGTGHTP